jgi:hypothetical protein
MMDDVCCLLLPAAVCRLPSAVCYLLPAACRLPPAACCFAAFCLLLGCLLEYVCRGFNA